MGFPTWRYRRGAFGRLESKIFDSDEIPPGWFDNPAKCEKPEKAKKPPARKNRRVSALAD